MAIHNPLLHPERIVRRAVADALETARPTRAAASSSLVREQLQDLILREQGRDRLPADHGAEGPDRPRLRGAVARRARDGAGGGRRPLRGGGRARPARRARPPVPAPRPALLGPHPLQRQDLRQHPARHHPRSAVPRQGPHRLPGQAPRSSPDRIVIEITEKLVIDNYNLFREAMAYFTDLGMSFAVDDVGAGYSGLEVDRAPQAPVPQDRHLARARRARERWSTARWSRPSSPWATASAPRSSRKASTPRTRSWPCRTMGDRLGPGLPAARPDPGPEPISVG